MQTFLPVADFSETARILDYRRLGKQRSEARQILKALLQLNNSWRNHPAVRMWEGFEMALIAYGNVMISEWKRRGYQNNMPILDLTGQITGIKFELVPETDYDLPPWFGHPPFHASHRSNLLRKDFNYYNQFGWTEGTDLPYYWPTKEGLCQRTLAKGSSTLPGTKEQEET